MPCRSGSPQRVFNDAAPAVAVSGEAWANAGATDSESAASAVVMAATIIELANLSRMLISVYRGASALVNYKGADDPDALLMRHAGFAVWYSPKLRSKAPPTNPRS